MKLKYCNNCKEWQESWSEHCKNSSYSDNRCWKCDKYELDTKRVINLPNSHMNKNEIRESFNKVEKGESAGFSQKVTACGSHYTQQTLECDKDGNYSYNSRTGEGDLARVYTEYRIEVPPKKGVCQIL